MSTDQVFTAEYYRGEKYPEYFKTAHWKLLNKQLIYSNKDAKCYICGKLSSLLIHHVSYRNLFAERLNRDVFILCFDCHIRAHFHRFTHPTSSKISLEEKTLRRRLRFLKLTNGVRNFRLGSWINSLL